MDSTTPTTTASKAKDFWDAWDICDNDGLRRLALGLALAIDGAERFLTDHEPADPAEMAEAAAERQRFWDDPAKMAETEPPVSAAEIAEWTAHDVAGHLFNLRSLRDMLDDAAGGLLNAIADAEDPLAPVYLGISYIVDPEREGLTMSPASMTFE